MMERISPNEENLSPLIEGIVESVQKETKCERAEQIRDAIECHLKTWLDEMENINPLFKVSELIQVGSYAEGTKIIHPDEFDFLAVIDDLSQPGSVIIDNSASDFQEGLVKVAVADDRLKSRWNSLCKNGHLHCFQPINFPVRDDKCRFGHVFISLLWKKVRSGKRIGPTSGSPTDIACRIQLPTVNNIPLFLVGADYKAPNVLIKFELENREITVDLSPAIRYHNIEDCFEAEDCVGPAFAELVLSRKSLLLIGTRNEFDFKVTVTEAEVQYMQSVMKKEHKLIYIFMKYIEKLYADHLNPVTSFSSYMLKTVCIHHDIKCKNKNRTVAKCLRSVIRELDVCTRQEYVISVVNRHIQLYPSFLLKMTETCRKSMLDGLRKLFQLPKKIHTVNEFGAFLMHLIQQERQRRDEEKSLLQQEIDQFYQSTVIQFIGMGFEPEEVHKAMTASFNDPDMAVEYLINGIPEHLVELALKDPKTTGPNDCETSYGEFFPLEPTVFEQTDYRAQTMHVGESCQISSGGLTCLEPAASAQTMDQAQCVGESRESISDELTDVGIDDPGKIDNNGEQASSSVHNIVTSQLGQSGEFPQNSSNGQNMVTCEILYQRQKQI